MITAHQLKSRLSAFRSDQSGAVAVEFALLAPLLFAMLFGIMVMGYFMGVSHSVSQLASGAARASVAGLDMAERTDLAQTYLAQAGTRYPLLKPDALQVQVLTEDAATPGIVINVSYAADAGVLGVAKALLGLEMDDVKGSAYLAY